MTLSYNLAYQEIILVHPTRRQIFLGKPYSTFWNIWDLLLEPCSNICRHVCHCVCSVSSESSTYKQCLAVKCESSAYKQCIERCHFHLWHSIIRIEVVCRKRTAKVDKNLRRKTSDFPFSTAWSDPLGCLCRMKKSTDQKNHWNQMLLKNCSNWK